MTKGTSTKVARGLKAFLLFFLSFHLAICFPLAAVAKAKQAASTDAVTSAASTDAVTSAASADEKIPVQLRTNPLAHSASLIEGAPSWSFLDKTRVVVNTAQSSNARLQEVAKLSASELLARGLSISLAFGDEDECGVDDIYVSLVPVSSIVQQGNQQRSLYDAFTMTIKGENQCAVQTDLNTPSQATQPAQATESDQSTQPAQATQSGPGIVINAATENAVLYAFNFLQNLYLLNGNKIPASTITDWADLPERRLFIDCGRKYFSKDWFIQTIREMSYLKLNTLDMHFSENMGFRIQCDTDPAIVSDQYLTKAEVREILAEAERYGINVIPSFDSPGHVDALLKVHPEYGQVSVSGTHYASGIDITNPKAVAYIKSLYKEYFDLFRSYSCVKDFSIGADEYMEFDRNPFLSDYQPILDDWAHSNLGPDYSWTDTLATYINTMAQFCKENGLRPRVFNDGLYYGENKPFKQKVALDPDLVVDFWSSIPWNRDVASLQTLLNRGLTDFNNINSTYTYFVLRTNGQASFDTPNNTELWWNEWSPDLFPGQSDAQQNDAPGFAFSNAFGSSSAPESSAPESSAPDNNLNVLGTGICVWCDNPTSCSEDEVSVGIADSLRYMACRTSNVDAPKQLSMDDFQNLIQRLGHCAGWEKGSTLPDAGEFVPIDSSNDSASIDFTESILPATGDPFSSSLFVAR